MSRLRIRRARVLDPAIGRDELASIEIDGGRIVAVGAEPAGRPDEVLEADGLWLAPGLVDLHAHLREPGQEYKEDIASGGRAAGRYGLGMLCVAATTMGGYDVLAENWKTACELAAERGETMDRAGLRLVGPMHIAETREQARANKNFPAADAIRDELTAAGVEIMDGDPIRWEWKITE